MYITTDNQKLRHSSVDTNFGGCDVGKTNIRMDTHSPSIQVRPATPSRFVRAIKTKSSRLGLGEGKHLLDSQLRRSERHQKRSQQLMASGMQSATSQASINSLMISQIDQDNRSVSSFLGPNCPDLPFPSYHDAGKSGLLHEGYDSDDLDSSSKHSDEFPHRRRRNLYRSGVRGTHALLRLAHLSKGHKVVEPLHLSSSLHKSPSYLSFRFVVSYVPF